MIFLGSFFLWLSCQKTSAFDFDWRTPEKMNELFEKNARREGVKLTRKNKRHVFARPAMLREIVKTQVAGDPAVETVSPQAALGDMVVRNTCTQNGTDENWLVTKAKFGKKYEGPFPGGNSLWKEYEPKSAEDTWKEFVIIPEDTRPFLFKAPWGTKMFAKPGDILVRDRATKSDLYRVARQPFDCTYEIK